MPFADLHLHTRYSDGTWLPDELAAEAKSLGLKAISLTDHDTVEGCDYLAAACAREGIEFIAGTELTAEKDGHEIHILGYLFDLKNPEFLREIAKFQTVRQDRIREIVARLKQLGIRIEADAVFALANCKSPGRPHVARTLVQAGVCGNLDEAFERFLKKHRPAWVPKFKLSAPEAIALLHRAGGLAVLAHPGLNRVDELIPGMVEAGLDGIECYHTKHTHTTTAHYLDMARRLKLLVTGGSDCHGYNKGAPVIGTVKLPYEQVERLKTYHAAWRQAALDQPAQPAASQPGFT
jgi:predicted metal-dependent phosphoesterase TrpH